MAQRKSKTAIGFQVKPQKGEPVAQGKSKVGNHKKLFLPFTGIKTEGTRSGRRRVVIRVPMEGAPDQELKFNESDVQSIRFGNAQFYKPKAE